MHLGKLKLTNFKNYGNQQLTLSTKLNCFVGDNGMGKTNLLDAIHYLCMCKSHFSLPDRQVIRHDEAFFRLDGFFTKQEAPEHIVCKFQPSKKKVIERNKIAYERLAEHIGRYPMVLVTPDDNQLLTDGSEYRRQFLDISLSQLDQQYLKALIHYNKVLQQRNAFLKQHDHPQQINIDLLEVYNHQLLQPAAIIHTFRKEFITNLIPAFQDYYAQISGEKETVSLEYQSQLSTSSMEALFEESKEKDCWLQRTTKGIHKDELKLKMNGFPVKKFASQGQLKSYLLALKLAQFEAIAQALKFKPILLLDDIFDKLDQHRVKQLLTLLLSQNFGQIFITDTHEHRIASIVSGFQSDYKEFRIDQGVATELIHNN